jgi:hypothetical protein
MALHFARYLLRTGIHGEGIVERNCWENEALEKKGEADG